jgi:hypothetical protein
MTANEMTKNIGKKGFVRLKGLTVPVRILDAKVSYGVNRYMITTSEEQDNIFNNNIWHDASSITILGQ